MAISAKRRNKITVNQRQYVWYVKLCDDNNGHTLHVISEDKRFIVQYDFVNPSGRHFITVMGKEFNSLAPSPYRRRFRCPQWDIDGVITPARVRELIEWSARNGTTLIEVDYHGHVVPFGGCCTNCGRDLRGMLSSNATDCCYCDSPIAERIA